MTKSCDILIVGGGIVGLATAFRILQSRPDLRLVLLEKESTLAKHQTGNNSGVIHSGLYYRPGSLKALNCIAGYRQLLTFCQDEGIPHEICGKVVVATNEKELPQLEMLYHRGIANGLDGIRWLTSQEISDVEPHCVGLRGIRVPQTGIVDYKAVAIRYGEKIREAGAEIFLSESVKDMVVNSSGVEIISDHHTWSTKFLVVCAGLQSDRLALKSNPNLPVRIIPLEGIETIIHLANIANDPSVDLNPSLSWEVNVLAAQQLADRAVRVGVKQFLYASSGSVYGVKEEPQVTEDLPLVPISVYNKTKMVAERVLLSYQDAFQVHCIRPATVCGFSPRMRLDVSVNMLTFQALKNGKITVFGGQQTRPNIHIQDMVNVYRHFLAHPELPTGCYNAGFENISILEIAERVQKRVLAEIVVTESNDPRSYRQNSDKLVTTGFSPQYSVDDAIEEIIAKYQSGELVESDRCYTVRWMKQLNI